MLLVIVVILVFCIIIGMVDIIVAVACGVDVGVGCYSFFVSIDFADLGFTAGSAVYIGVEGCCHSRYRSYCCDCCQWC